MVDLAVFRKVDIDSHKGMYSVFFEADLNQILKKYNNNDKCHFIIDSKVAHLYSAELDSVLSDKNTIIIEATEDNKSVEKIIPIFNRLVNNHVRRQHQLIAIGGGIIQDITCFIASTLLRGLPWKFFPTTLLAQADSCIGSKSSINLGSFKNIIGTFNPPVEIFICHKFLNTLDLKDINSGIGEILKVHAIDSMSAFDNLCLDYDKLHSDRKVMLSYIHKALLIKKRFIEEDEFDKGIRNIFNYGHSFGHAIEAATNFLVPHGIAVSMGMDIANFISAERALMPRYHYDRMHNVLKKNYNLYSNKIISFDSMFSALLKDKKNTTDSLVLILPVGEHAAIERIEISPDSLFFEQLNQSIQHIKL
jgi:3-dehydroquinate synthase